MLKIGVIGYGYWGPNIVRNFHHGPDSRVAMVCDRSPRMLERVNRDHPDTKTTSDSMEIMQSTEIDAVAVVTPVWTHYELGKQTLLNGKHLFIEKPFTCNVEQADELIELAASKELLIMVDHTFLYTGAVRKIREFIDDGTLGKLYY